MCWLILSYVLFSNLGLALYNIIKPTYLLTQTMKSSVITTTINRRVERYLELKQHVGGPHAAAVWWSSVSTITSWARCSALAAVSDRRTSIMINCVHDSSSCLPARNAVVSRSTLFVQLSIIRVDQTSSSALVATCSANAADVRRDLAVASVYCCYFHMRNYDRDNDSKWRIWSRNVTSAAWQTAFSFI